MPSGAEFSHLHNLLVEHQELKDRLARGPKIIQARKNKIAEAQNLLTVKEVELKHARAAVDKKNLNLKSKESDQLTLQGKLNGASSNREYDIISGQMKADKAATAVLEDEILELMERVDLINSEIAECKESIKQTEADAIKFATDFEMKAAGLKQDEEKLAAQISEAEKILSSEIKAQYKRLVASFGPDALASAENGNCNSCFVSLTAQNMVSLNSGHTMFCGTCGRLLYIA